MVLYAEFADKFIYCLRMQHGILWQKFNIYVTVLINSDKQNWRQQCCCPSFQLGLTEKKKFYKKNLEYLIDERIKAAKIHLIFNFAAQNLINEIKS